MIKLTKREMGTLAELRRQLSDYSLPRTLRQKAYDKIKDFWRRVEAKYHIDSFNIREVREDGEVIML